jgi:hypothetical protein
MPDTTTPAGDSGSTSADASAQSTASTLLSILGDVVNAFLNPGQDVNLIADALGLWTAARAAVSTVASGIAAAATQTTINNALAKYQDIPLTWPTLADAVVRNILPDSTGRIGHIPGGPDPEFPGGVAGNTATQEAALTGMSGDRFAVVAANTGESYGILDALRLWNRGQYLYDLTPNSNYPYGTPLYSQGSNLADTYGITDAELAAVVAYSRTRPQFYDDFLKLAKNGPSPSDVVEMAVKQVVETDVAQSLFEAAGGIGNYFQPIVDAAGDSLPVDHAILLLNAGLITEPEYEAIRALSRVNPRFYDLMPLLLYKALPIYEIRQAVMNGTLPEATALDMITKQGYATADAKTFLDAVELGAIGTAKAESEGMILADWEAGLVTEAQATAALTALGEKSWAIPFILDTVIAKKVTTQRNAVVTRVRSSVLVGDVTTAQATTYLTQLGWPAAAASETVNDWVIEAETPKLLLSVAQIGKLAEEGYVTQDFAVAYWRKHGYTTADAQLLLYIYPPASKAQANYTAQVQLLAQNPPTEGETITAALTSLVEDLTFAAAEVQSYLSSAAQGALTGLENETFITGTKVTATQAGNVSTLLAAVQAANAAHPQPASPSAYVFPTAGTPAKLPPPPASVTITETGPPTS